MGSAARYRRRKRLWAEKRRVAPQVRHHLWWLAHNCVSHPALGLIPNRQTVWFHDWTSQHLNCRDRIRPSKMPEIKDWSKWAWHNTAGHILIGLFPAGFTFAYHDLTADEMKVKHWL